MSTTRYKVNITEFKGEGESLAAQALYEQTVTALNIRKVIEAVNADAEFKTIATIPPIRRRTRSDKGTRRQPKVTVTENI